MIIHSVFVCVRACVYYIRDTSVYIQGASYSFHVVKLAEASVSKRYERRTARWQRESKESGPLEVVFNLEASRFSSFRSMSLAKTIRRNICCTTILCCLCHCIILVCLYLV